MSASRSSTAFSWEGQTQRAQEQHPACFCSAGTKGNYECTTQGQKRSCLGGQCHLWTLLLPAPGGIGPRPRSPPGLAAFNAELACRELQSCSSPPAAQMGSFSSPGTSVWALHWDAQPHQTSYPDSTGRDRLIRLLSGNPPCWEPLLTSLHQFLLSSQTQGSVQLLCNSLLHERGGRWD